MAKRGLLAILTLVLFSYPARAANTGPSFDCAKVKPGSVEEYICSDPELAAADKEVADLYHALMARLTPEQRVLVANDQRRWRKVRDIRCQQIQCDYIYRMRSIELRDFINDLSLVNSGTEALDRLAAITCREDSGCTIVSHRSAGPDRQGHELWVVEGAKNLESHDPSNFFLVSMQSGKILQKQLLTVLQPYDSAPGFRRVEVASGTVSVSRYVGSHEDATSTSDTIQLDPLQMLKSSLFSKGRNWTWDWKTFSGSGTSGFGENTNYLIVPSVPITDDFWDKTPLGNCALDLSDKNAFLLQGLEEPPKTTVLKALLAKEGVLIVNVYGDSWTREDPNGEFDDHLIILQHGYENFKKYNEQWKIRVADGMAWPSDTSNIHFADLKSKSGQKVRAFHIKLKRPDGGNLAIGYSSGDGHKKVKWNLSSSEADNYGDAMYIDPKYASCVPENGALTVKHATEFNKNEPLF